MKVDGLTNDEVKSHLQVCLMINEHSRCFSLYLYLFWCSFLFQIKYLFIFGECET